jgi:glutaconyl-CoA/methylmalonyl-CoA decarboxylase subunit gamma
MIMEAMKMENNIIAEADGVLKAIMVKEGQNVLQGDTLAEIE